MSTRKKPSNSKHLKLRRKLFRIVSAQRKMDSIMGNILTDLDRLVKVIDKIKPDYPK